MGHLIYPMSVQDTAKSGIGCRGNRCLHHLVERIGVNVGGPCGEGSSPPVKRMSVGGVIVLGGRESRLQGEGRQGIDTPKVEINRHMLVNSGRTVCTVAR
jgi:hypothetical protein